MKNKLLFLLIGGIIGAVAVFLFNQVNFGGSQLGFLDPSSKINIEAGRTRASGPPNQKEIQSFIDSCHNRGGTIVTTESLDGSTYMLCMKLSRGRVKILDSLDLDRSY